MEAGVEFRLRLLGRFDFRRAETPDEAIIFNSKKACGLLAYLAMQDEQRATRERLATVFWGDRVDRQARQNLRQCLALLREQLGSGADKLLRVNNDEVSLVPDHLSVDAIELARFSEHSSLSELQYAAGLYRGKFLANLTLDQEIFTEWLAEERVRVDLLAGRVLFSCAHKLDEHARGQEALALASRLISIDPLREQWQRLNLEMLAKYEGRDAALAHAKTFTTRLKQELGVEPDFETNDIVEQIKRGSYAAIKSEGNGNPNGRRTAAIAPAPAASSDIPVEIARSGHVAPGSKRSRRLAFAAAAGLAAAGIAFWVADGLRSSSAVKQMDISSRRETIRMILSPFRTASDGPQQFAGVLTDDLAASLARFSGLTVVRIGSHSEVEDWNARSGNAARYLVEGSVRRQSPNVRINAALVEASSRIQVWADSFTIDEDQFPVAEPDIIRRLSRELQVQIAYAEDERRPPADAVTALNETVAKGLAAQYRGPTQDEISQALAHYEDALKRDPDSPLALIGVAAQLEILSANLLRPAEPNLTRAEELVSRALQLSPQMERAHYWHGNIQSVRGKFETAWKSHERALELNPSFIPAQAHAGFALVRMGRVAEGLERIEHAMQLSPRDPNMHVWLRFAGLAQLELGQLDQAIESLTRGTALALRNPPIHIALAAAYALKGDNAKAVDELRIARRLADPAAFAAFLERLGRPGRSAGPQSWFSEGLRRALAKLELAAAEQPDLGIR
jgi:DNA-binding SARP family transcriptional activator/TolB-like protein